MCVCVFLSLCECVCLSRCVCVCVCVCARTIAHYLPLPGQYQLDLLLNVEEYEYFELTNQRVGVLIIIHEANKSPFLWPTYVMASPGMHTRIEIHSSRVSTSASHHHHHHRHRHISSHHFILTTALVAWMPHPSHAIGGSKTFSPTTYVY